MFVMFFFSVFQFIFHSLRIWKISVRTLEIYGFVWMGFSRRARNSFVNTFRIAPYTMDWFIYAENFMTISVTKHTYMCKCALNPRILLFNFKCFFFKKKLPSLLRFIHWEWPEHALNLWYFLFRELYCICFSFSLCKQKDIHFFWVLIWPKWS